MFDDPQISLYYNLKHYDLKLRLKICAPTDVIAKANAKWPKLPVTLPLGPHKGGGGRGKAYYSVTREPPVKMTNVLMHFG